MHSAFLLAAGFGTRMRPLTAHRAKPLVPIVGRPLLDQSVELLRRNGFKSAVMNVHHLPEGLIEWAKGQEFPIEISHETPEILGTGGGLRFALHRLDDRFVVVNGDILCDVNLRGLIEALPTSGAGATMALRQAPDGERYGVVASDEAGRVVDLVGLAACEAQGEVDRSTHFTGIHALTRGAVELLPEEGFSCIVRASYVKMVPNGEVQGRRHSGIWEDAGDPRSYLAANLGVLRGEISPPLDTLPLAGWCRANGREFGSREAINAAESATFEEPFWIGRGASIGERVRVGPESIIGEDAHIGEGCSLERSVVWDRCELPAGERCEETIVHDGGALHLLDRAEPEGA